MGNLIEIRCKMPGNRFTLCKLVRVLHSPNRILIAIQIRRVSDTCRAAARNSTEEDLKPAISQIQ